MNMGKIAVGIALLIVISVIFVSARNMISGQAAVSGAAQNTITGAVASGVQSGEVQNVKLSYINGKYQIEPNILKVGVPVRMEVDLSTVQGCMQTVTIPAFNVQKYVKSGDNTIEFTPTKAGVFNIACSMGMGRNTFTVEDSSGKTADYAEPQPAATGGCGCGGGSGSCSAK
jgi:heme/copper-type cytochrome/quinol oxidase subunit 2